MESKSERSTLTLRDVPWLLTQRWQRSPTEEILSPST